MAECNDTKCPKHGQISVRGTVFTGTVVSAKPGKTAVVERTIVKFVPKFERYKKSKSRIYAHNPDCIGAKEDDIVKLGETRKLSKTKSFVVLEVVGKKKTVKVEEDTFRDNRRKKEGEGAEEDKEKEAVPKEEKKEDEEKEKAVKQEKIESQENEEKEKTGESEKEAKEEPAGEGKQEEGKDSEDKK
jgi:small subunit ribosomal protein S17